MFVIGKRKKDWGVGVNYSCPVCSCSSVYCTRCNILTAEVNEEFNMNTHW